jgi:hypothetical protein
MGLTASAMLICRARGEEASERWLCCSSQYLGLMALEAVIEYHVLIFLLCFVSAVQTTYTLSVLLGVGLGLLVLGACVVMLFAYGPQCALPSSVLTFFIVGGPLFIALGQMSINVRQQWYDSVINLRNVSGTIAADVIGPPKLIRFLSPVVTLPSLMYSYTAPPSSVPLLYCQHRTGVCISGGLTIRCREMLQPFPYLANLSLFSPGRVFILVNLICLRLHVCTGHVFETLHPPTVPPTQAYASRVYVVPVVDAATAQLNAVLLLNTTFRFWMVHTADQAPAGYKRSAINFMPDNTIFPGVIPDQSVLIEFSANTNRSTASSPFFRNLDHAWFFNDHPS